MFAVQLVCVNVTSWSFKVLFYQNVYKPVKSKEVFHYLMSQYIIK